VSTGSFAGLFVGSAEGLYSVEVFSNGSLDTDVNLSSTDDPVEVLEQVELGRLISVAVSAGNTVMIWPFPSFLDMSEVDVAGSTTGAFFISNQTVTFSIVGAREVAGNGVGGVTALPDRALALLNVASGYQHEDLYILSNTTLLHFDVADTVASTATQVGLNLTLPVAPPPC
jgi:hypothetical protein